MLIPDAFSILSEANLKIASLGSEIIDQEGTPKQPKTIRQLIRVRQLYNILNKFIFLNTGGTAIDYTIGQNDAALNRLLLQLKRSAKIASFPVIPNPIQTFVSTFQNSGDIIIINNNLSGINNIDMTGSLSVIQNISVGGSVTISGALNLSTPLGITSGGTGLNAIGSANTILGVDNAGTALEYKTVSNGLTSSTGSFILGGTLTQNTTLTGNGATGDFTVTRTNTGKTNSFSITNGGISLFSSHATQNEINIYTTNGAGINSIIDLIHTGITIDTPKIEIIGTAATVPTSGSITTKNYVLGAKTFLGKQTFIASVTTAASLNIPSGTTPTTGIADGDLWQNSNHLFARLGGVTYQLDQQSPLSGLTAGTIPVATSATAIGDSIITVVSGGIVITGSNPALTVSGGGAIFNNGVSITSGLTVSTGDSVFTGGFRTEGTLNNFIKIVDIGDWNMDSAENASIAHGLGSNFIKIKDVSVIIIRDDSSYVFKLETFDNASETIQGGVLQINNTNIYLYRKSAGFFDSVNFDSTSFNRGFVKITYSS